MPKMAEMIQMISALSSMQSQKRQLALQEKTFDEQKSQFAQSFGFQKGEADYKKIVNLLGDVLNANHESRDGLIQLGTALKLDPQAIQAIAHVGQSAPETLAMMRTMAAKRGYDQANAGDQSAMNREAASGAMTGMNMGGVAQSGYQANTVNQAGQAFQALTPEQKGAMLHGFNSQQLTGMPVGTAAIQDQTASIPGLAAFAARAGAGQIMTAAQQAQTDIGRGGVQADFYRTNAQMIDSANQTAARLASSKALGGLQPSDYIQGINSLREIAVAAGKEKDSSNRMKLAATWNSLAEKIDPRLMIKSQDEIFSMAGKLDAVTSAMNPPGLPSMMPGSQPFAPPMSIPMGPMGGIPTAPLSPGFMPSATPFNPMRPDSTFNPFRP